MKQTKLESLLETTVNIATGFIISWGVWLWMVPIIWPQHVSTVSVGFGITCLFTVTSFLRSYIWRRFFNAGVHRAVHKLVRDYAKT